MKDVLAKPKVSIIITLKSVLTLPSVTTARLVLGLLWK
jgi:hypothetical protein